jgi:hypothetical protein
MSERNSKQYLAWIGQLRLCLAQLGMKQVESDKVETLTDYLAGKVAAE